MVSPAPRDGKSCSVRSMLANVMLFGASWSWIGWFRGKDSPMGPSCVLVLLNQAYGIGVPT